MVLRPSGLVIELLSTSTSSPRASRTIGGTLEHLKDLSNSLHGADLKLSLTSECFQQASKDPTRAPRDVNEHRNLRTQRTLMIADHHYTPKTNDRRTTRVQRNARSGRIIMITIHNRIIPPGYCAMPLVQPVGYRLGILVYRVVDDAESGAQQHQQQQSHQRDQHQQ